MNPNQQPQPFIPRALPVPSPMPEAEVPMPNFIPPQPVFPLPPTAQMPVPPPSPVMPQAPPAAIQPGIMPAVVPQFHPPPTAQMPVPPPPPEMVNSKIFTKPFTIILLASVLLVFIAGLLFWSYIRTP